MQPSSHQPTPRKKHKKLGLLLVIGPTALFLLAFILFFIARLMAAPVENGDLFDQSSPGQQLFNSLGFICSLIGFLTWLPGLIVGIILLAKKN